MATLKLKQPSARVRQQQTDRHHKISRQGPEQRKQREHDVFGYLQKRYRNLFNLRVPVPLAIGIAKQLRQHHSWPWPDARSKALHCVLTRWTRRSAYLLAVAAPGSKRIDLQGNSTPVSTEHQQIARQQYLHRHRSGDDMNGKASAAGVCGGIVNGYPNQCTTNLTLLQPRRSRA